MSDPTAGRAPASPAVDDLKKEVTYRPLSVLALVGLGLAGFYTAVVVIGGVVTFYHGDPWLMSGWWVVLPLAAAVLSLLGLSQVQRSEGTLAGDRAARWGLLLSLVVGLGYWAYFGATYFAITREADRAGREYLAKLADRDVYGAFRLTLPAADRPPEDEHLRPQLERRFNNLGGQGGLKTPLSSYYQSEPVRMIGIGGPEAKFEPLGVDKWDYVNGGYQVGLLYRVSMPDISYEMELTLIGKEGKHGEGRQWEVRPGETGMRTQPEMTAAGKNRLAQSMGARMLLMKDWLYPMSDGRLEPVVLATKPPAERATARAPADATRGALLLADVLRSGANGGAGPGAFGLSLAYDLQADLARPASLPGLKEFLAGDLVKTDHYWAPDDIRDEAIRLVREQFRLPDAQLTPLLTPDMNSRGLPFMQLDGDRFVVGYDLNLMVPRGQPLYLVEARLILDCDRAEVDAGAVRTLYIHSLDLISAKSLPSGVAPPPQAHPMMRPGM